MSKKPFVLGDDVARALDEIVSINDDLPEAYRREAKARALEDSPNGNDQNTN